jgi:hypothetical protein
MKFRIRSLLASRSILKELESLIFVAKEFVSTEF